jgi:predicted TIM-barrel fold metal-dependent hydrolase
MVSADMSIERLAAAVQGHNVTHALAISTVGVFHGHADGNADTLQSCQNHPELLPVATIDPRGYFGMGNQISSWISQGIRMFRFFPAAQGWPLNHAVFSDVLDELEPTSVPVMISAGRTGDASALAGIIGGRKHPLILENISFETLAEAISVMRKYENICLETHGLTIPSALRFLIDQVGSDRVIFGSGCMRSSLGGALTYVLESEISDQDKAKILGANMKRLLGG